MVEPGYLRRLILCLSCYLDECSTLVWRWGTSKYSQERFNSGALLASPRVNISLFGKPRKPFLNIQQKNRSELWSRPAGGGRSRWNRSTLRFNKQQQGGQTECLQKGQNTHIKVTKHSQTRPRYSVCLLVFGRPCVYLVGVTVMTVCCHRGQRSNGERGVSARCWWKDGGALSLLVSCSEDWVCFGLAWGGCVCVSVCVHALVLPRKQTRCWEISVCVMTVRRAHSQICTISIHTSTFSPISSILLVNH